MTVTQARDDQDAIAAQGGDRKAGDRLMRRYMPLALAAAKRRLVSNAARQDAAAAAMLAVIEALPRFDPARDCPFRNFARSIIRWEITRWRCIEAPELHEELNGHDVEDDQAPDVDAHILCEQVRRHVGALPPPDRDVLLLSLEDRTHAEIASVFQVSRRRITFLAARGVDRLREVLA